VLQELCRKFCEIHPAKGLSRLVDLDVDQLFKILIKSDNLDLFETAARHSCGTIPLVFFSWARDEMQAGGISFERVKNG
jgi:hypothetical protein